MVRLTIINKSGYDVYIKLTGSGITQGFYYLTIPAGDRLSPTIKVFTIQADLYERETWQCGVYKSSGSFFVDGNVRLTFIPCGDVCWACILYGWAPNTKCWYNWWTTWDWHHGCARHLGTGLNNGWFFVGHRWAGEPRMEKVTYFKVLWGPGRPSWALAYLYTGYLNIRCTTLWYRIRTYMLPYGCQWRYQY
jgi:hypothetical protein